MLQLLRKKVGLGKTDGHASGRRFDGNLAIHRHDDISVDESAGVVGVSGCEHRQESVGVAIRLSTREELLEASTKDDT